MELHSLCRLIGARPRTTPRHLPASQVRGHRSPVHAVPLGQLVDARSGEVVVHETINLRSGEKSLKMFNPPHHRATRVPNRGGIRTLRHPDQGV